MYHLIRDFLLVLGTDPDRETVLNGSPSVLAKKYRKAEGDFKQLTKLLNECAKRGQVYMLVSSPRKEDRDRMWFAGDRGTRFLGSECFQPTTFANSFDDTLFVSA